MASIHNEPVTNDAPPFFPPRGAHSSSHPRLAPPNEAAQRVPVRTPPYAAPAQTEALRIGRHARLNTPPRPRGGLAVTGHHTLARGALRSVHPPTPPTPTSTPTFPHRTNENSALEQHVSSFNPKSQCQSSTIRPTALNRGNARRHPAVHALTRRADTISPWSPETVGDQGEHWAEDGGFEPPRACTQHAFQACAIGH